MPSYDAFAPHFDAWQQAFGGAYDDLILARVVSAIRRHAPHARRVADLGIGTGDLVIALADAGFDVVGVDVSAPMLAAARAKLGARTFATPLVLIEQDLRALALPAPTDAAVCVYTVINQLVAAGDLDRACASVARALAPDGVFVFELNLPASYARWWSGTDTMALPDGGRVTRAHRRGAGDVIIADVTIHTAAGDTVHDVIEQRPYDDATVTAALARAGLRAVACETYDPFDPAGAPIKALWSAQRA